MGIRTAMPFLAVLGMLMSGCSGDSGNHPTTLPSLTSTPSATASPEPVPAAARAKTPQGADAFVRFFFKQLNLAFARGGPVLISRLSTTECVLCDTYEKSVADARSRGHFLDADTFVVGDVAAAPLQKLGTRVEVVGHTPSRRLIDEAGKVLQTVPSSGDFHFEVTLRRLTDGWVVADIHERS